MNYKQCKTVFVCRLPILLATLTLLLFLAGVKPAAAVTPAFIRVIHASPDIGTADVFVDGSVLLSSFQFGAVTDYAAIPPGTHKVQIALVGKGTGAALISQELAVSPGMVYTVAATGTSATGLGLEVFIDNNVVNGKMAKLRVYHLSPDAGSVSVSNGGNTVLSGITYRQASEYLSFPANAYTFDVNASALSSSLPVSVTVKPDTVASIFAVGLVKGTPSIQLVSTQANGTPSLPNTGSDPNAVTSVVNNNSSLQMWTALEPWLLGMLIIVVLGIGTATVGRRIMR